MLIGLCGTARAGKDSVANMLVARYGYTKLGFADGVRDMAKAIDPFVHVKHPQEARLSYQRYTDVLAYYGYEALKANPDVRRLLQRIGTEAVREVIGDSTWIDLTLEKARATGGDVVISDVRFPNEAEAIKAAGGILVRIERPGYDNGLTLLHPSEAQVADIEANATITATNMDELIAGTELFMAGLSQYVETMARVEAEPEPVRIYLAAPWSHKFDAMGVKDAMVNAGLNVVSTWTEWPEATDPAQLSKNAISDWNEMRSADVLVILNLGKSDGKASEMGGALALGKRVILVGPKEGNIFYHLPTVEQVDSVEAAIVLLGGIPSTDEPYSGN